jgi:hypothetical protein
MPKIWYRSKRFGVEAQKIIDLADQTLIQYSNDGYVLTLRQLYYWFVSHVPGFPNSINSYKKFGTIINDARMAGLLDWDAIEDRTRNLKKMLAYDTVDAWVDYAARVSQYPLWDDQPQYVEVWVEKDALLGVIQRAADPLRVPYFSCRGYTSQSEMWGASQRIHKKLIEGKEVTILHFGDHDPSGMDMTRDIRDRLEYFIQVDELRRQYQLAGFDSEKTPTKEEWTDLHRLVGEIMNFSVERMALNWDQVQEYDPPPNPAKLGDSRSTGYIREFGSNSWELDALEPQVIGDLITNAVTDRIEWDLWDAARNREADQQNQIQWVADHWEDVSAIMPALEDL